MLRKPLIKVWSVLQVHHVTRQIEYHGELMSLTEAIIGFPVGGQVLISGSTYQRIYGRLHTIGPLASITATSKSKLHRSRSLFTGEQPALPELVLLGKAFLCVSS